MMHSNLIAEIVKSGVISDWVLAEDNSKLHHEFKFGNPRSATYYMNEVSQYCSEHDHHPEWSLKGSTLSVKLTSHFNNNQVSLSDY